MGAPSKRARKVRSATEFNVSQLTNEIAPPRYAGVVYSWTLDDIYAARNAQMRGYFRQAARLAESMRTDDALAVAYENRLAPQRCIKVELVPAKDNARGAAIAGEAEALFGQEGVGIRAETLSDIHGCLVNHGIAFAVNVATPREDGSRVDFEVKPWPIEFVRWDIAEQCFKTLTIDGPEEVITHGDGRWTIFRKHEIEPWKQEAAVIPGSLVWARHAFAIRDWSKGSVAHGNAKVVGEMPMGMALQSADGKLNPEAAAFLDLLRAIGNGDSPVGIRPAGSKTDFLTNNSNAWQVWNELVQNAERAAARIYLGTDGTLGAQGGAPGVDIDSLFGVAKTKVEGDLHCIERAISTGVIEPWCALNFGDSSLAPKRKYMIPDGDEDARMDSLSKRTAAFSAALKGLADAGLAVKQEYVDAVAKGFDVPAPIVVPAPVPTAAPAAPASVTSIRSVR